MQRGAVEPLVHRSFCRTTDGRLTGVSIPVRTVAIGGEAARGLRRDEMPATCLSAATTGADRLRRAITA
ncbi:hypothetical protein [Kitasatospora sp. NPDC058190]|uniref:hypothetical protein n=1 Tax=Kitasatospora sp. NPDC058190 TaxID=3346371 RepID=UPI0036D871E6